MNNKEVYKSFCKKDQSIPLFYTYDWLETIAPGKWDVAIEYRDIDIAGFLPFIKIQKFGFLFIRLPQYTPYGGVWINYPHNQKPETRLKFEKEIIYSLINQLPAFDYFSHNFYPTFKNWLPFYWKRFSQTTKYTYIINNLSNIDDVFNNFSTNTKREIKKASNSEIVVEESLDIDLLYNLRFETYQANGIKTKLSENIKIIYKAAKEKKFGELLIAKDKETIYAASLFVWDFNTCYYLFGASNPDFKNSGAMSLLLWEAMKRYSSKVNEFNFEGSMLENVERFFRSFGAIQTPYFVIKKVNSPILKFREFISEL